MKFETLEKGTRIFIDSNIFIYHFTEKSEECTSFLYKCGVSDYAGITSVSVLIEVMHRLMLLEATKKKITNPSKTLRQLLKAPEKVRLLTDYSLAVRKIREMGIEILPISLELLETSHSYRNHYGLLINDSLIVAMMDGEGISHLASNDSAFSQVDWIELYQPTDI